MNLEDTLSVDYVTNQDNQDNRDGNDGNEGSQVRGTDDRNLHIPGTCIQKLATIHPRVPRINAWDRQ